MGTKDAIADKATGTLRPKTEAPSRAIYILRYTILVFAVLMAWCLSFFTRLEWVPVAKGNQLMQWESNLLPTTHDSYVYLSVIQQNTNRDQSGEELKKHPKKSDYGALTDIGVLVCRHSNISPMTFAIYFLLYGWRYLHSHRAYWKVVWKYAVRFWGSMLNSNRVQLL